MLAAERGAAANTLAAYRRDLKGAQRLIGRSEVADEILGSLEIAAVGDKRVRRGPALGREHSEKGFYRRADGLIPAPPLRRRSAAPRR